MQKVVLSDSFDYGVDDSLVKIVDDPAKLKSKVASCVRDEWGNITPEKGRTLVHIIALGSFEKTGKNQNADAFEEYVCKRSHKDFVKRARLYRHHKKTAEEEKDGDVVKSSYNEKMGRVELLISAIDEKCADWLGELDRGGSVKFSMGWNCENHGDICSICGHNAKRREDYCNHLHKSAKAPYGLGKILPDGRACFTYNRDGHWNDISYVDRGADMIAMDLGKIASIGDSVIGGAELAELMGVADEQTESKNGILTRVSEFVQKMATAGVFPVVSSGSPLGKIATLKREKLDDVFQSALSSGANIGFSDFCELIANKMAECSSKDIQSAKDNFSEIVIELLSSKDRMSKVSHIKTFDGLILGRASSVDVSVLEGRNLDKIATISSAMDSKNLFSSTEQTKLAKAIVENYVAYKLSLLSNNNMVNDETLFDHFILN
jgi:hypothetical protein